MPQVRLGQGASYPLRIAKRGGYRSGKAWRSRVGGLLHSWERSFVGMRRMWKQLVMALNFPVLIMKFMPSPAA
jgi:hypothetical protein